MSPPPVEMKELLCRFGELWLKGRNREQFILRLVRNVASALGAEMRGAQVRFGRGRLFVEVAEPHQLPRALAICADTPGLTSVSPALRINTDLDAIEGHALALATEAWRGISGTFAVQSHRADKRLPFTSPALNARVGLAVQQATGLPVDLDAPEHVLGIEVGHKSTWLWVRTVPAPGGLPIGTAGRVLLLLSGGIDSPVAGYLAQKRGCELEAIYFHSPPFVSEATRDKVEALAARLAPRQGGLRLHIVPFAAVQTAIRAHCDPRLTVLLYRRFMYRIATEMAHHRRAKALCTGENLGQVASQTIENLTLVDQVTDLLTLRPLLTFDKLETIDIARHIDTFDISIRPHEDCCTLFVPKNPATRATQPVIERAESRLDVDALVRAAVAGAERVDL
ncbi:MAG: tRNA 4-thiouridine(8) synthase ThiI [Myxococcales bacterium]|nr:tRNA 4-thiouridine(8) synthase ThiI [Myxococcales bacterium]